MLQHRAVLSLGHDEYYSTTIYDALELARDHGVNLAFLGANVVYRRIRLEPGADGTLSPPHGQLPLGQRPPRSQTRFRNAPSTGAIHLCCARRSR